MTSQLSTARPKLSYTKFKAPVANKYRNKRCELDGFRFDSMKECNYYVQLKRQVMAGDVLTFLRQVPFHLPGSVKYIADFLVFYASGEVAVIDVKGVKTTEYKTKKKLVEFYYPVVITEV